MVLKTFILRKNLNWENNKYFYDCNLTHNSHLMTIWEEIYKNYQNEGLVI